MVTSADTSFLFSVYGNDANSAKAIEWLSKNQTCIEICEPTEFELGNALRFAEFRKVLPPGAAAILWTEYESDRDRGLIVCRPCNLSRVFSQAKRISAAHTICGGHRSWDVLNVAATLEVGAKLFLTFDQNQKKLTILEGLITPL